MKCALRLWSETGVLVIVLWLLFYWVHALVPLRLPSLVGYSVLKRVPFADMIFKKKGAALSCCYIGGDRPSGERVLSLSE